MGAVAERITEVESKMREKVEENDRLIATMKDEDGKGHYVISPEDRKHFDANLKEINDMKSFVSGLRGQAEAESFLKGVDGGATSTAAAAAAAAGSGMPGSWGGAQAKTLGQRFIESEEFKALKGPNGEPNGYNMGRDFTVDGRDLGGQWGQKDIYTYYPTGPAIQPHFGATQFDPLVIQAFRRTRVRDLFPVQTTSANLIDFFRVSGFANQASVVPERSGGAFGIKPQSTLTIVAAQAPVRIIAHFEVAHRNVIMDEPQLQGLINNELLYGLRLQEDYQILQGTGTGEDLLGILNTPGIQGYSHNPNAVAPANIIDNKADDIRRAATKAILAYYEPTGVIEHPYDWEATELAKDQYGRYLVAGGVAVGADKTLWQMPVVDTPAMPQGTALVGAFGLGAQLYDRELGNVRIAEQHADFFIRNAVVVLAEQRLALAVKRPESFVKVLF